MPGTAQPGGNHPAHHTRQWQGVLDDPNCSDVTSDSTILLDADSRTTDRDMPRPGRAAERERYPLSTRSRAGNQHS